jgi:hypothetical protein
VTVAYESCDRDRSRVAVDICDEDVESGVDPAELRGLERAEVRFRAVEPGAA